MPLDLSSAFDTIDHKVLLDRLRIRYGFSGTVLDWFRSYLSNRTQSVKIGKDLSAESEVRYGVPQGSVLGPLLFSLFFAPVEDEIKAHGLDCMMYADDSLLYIVINPRSDRSAFLSKIELCVSDVFTCCTKNGLACNPGKTEVVHFRLCHARTCEPIKTITIGNAAILAMPVVRDLGALLDQLPWVPEATRLLNPAGQRPAKRLTLVWPAGFSKRVASGTQGMDQHLLLKKQIKNICKGAWYVIQKIGRIRPYLSQEVCERLVNTFISSKLDSDNSILYGLPVTELNKLQHVQNAVARLISRTPKSHHITPVLQQLHWLPVKDRISFKLLLLTFKALHGLAPIYISELIKPYNPSRSLRSSTLNYLSVPKSNTATYGDRCFAVAAPKLWNSLPGDFRVTLKTCALLKLVLRHGFLNPHLI